MKFTPGLRWACYAIAAVATAAAMWRVDQGAAPADAVQAVRPVPRGTAWPVSGSAPAAPAAAQAASGDTFSILKQRLDAAISGGKDPFSDGAPPAPVAAAPVQQQASAAAPAEAVKPAAPFTFIGRWQEQGQSVVFLQAGDHVLTVRGPGPLEGGYVAEAVTGEGVTIRSASGARQTVSFAAAATPAVAGAGSAPVQTTASTPSGSPEEN